MKDARSSRAPLLDEFFRRYQALLHTASLAAQRGLPDLLQELSKRLHELFDFNFLSYSLHDETAGVMSFFMLDETSRTPGRPNRAFD